MVLLPSSGGGRLTAASRRMRRRVSGRERLIAGQAALVAILIAIVWAAFLRGGDSGTLSGIDAGGGPQATNLDRHNRAGEGGQGAGENRGGGPGGNGAGGGAALTGPVAGGETVSGTGTGTTPGESQYGDTLALLKQQLGIAGSLSGGDRKLRRR